MRRLRPTLRADPDTQPELTQGALSPSERLAGSPRQGVRTPSGAVPCRFLQFTDRTRALRIRSHQPTLR